MFASIFRCNGLVWRIFNTLTDILALSPLLSLRQTGRFSDSSAAIRHITDTYQKPASENHSEAGFWCSLGVRVDDARVALQRRIQRHTGQLQNVADHEIGIRHGVRNIVPVFSNGAIRQMEVDGRNGRDGVNSVAASLPEA